MVLASTEDHAALFGEDEPEAVAAALLAAGVAEQVVKYASPCCRVIADGTDAVVAAAPVSAVLDTTAAGDSFAAAYLAARLAGRDPPDAARAGHDLAGLVVQHRGAIIPRSAMAAFRHPVRRPGSP